MFDVLDELLADLRDLLSEADPSLVESRTAKELVERFAEVERLGAAGKTLFARRVAETRVWGDEGDRSAAHWLARTTGSTVREAVGTIETSRRLEGLHATEEALRAGELSAIQAQHVAAAAAVDRNAEEELLASVGTESVQGLRQACRRVQATTTAVALRDRYEAVHRNRYLHHWTDGDGAFRLDASLTPDAGATVLAALAPHRDRIERDARAAGRSERAEALTADALVALAEAGGSVGRRATVQVRVDHAAFVRGHAEPGETCEIPGVGPIPVATARHLADDAVLSVVVTDGTDVRAVARTDRHVPTAIRAALEARDPACAVEGCDARDRLEIHHLVPFAEGGPTSLDNLARLCRWHHHLVTHRGRQLHGPPGRRRLDPP
jgi:hypothetical protein